jgi:hypothetical protein
MQSFKKASSKDGRLKFLIRLLGDSSASKRPERIIPIYFNTQNSFSRKTVIHSRFSNVAHNTVVACLASSM